MLHTFLGSNTFTEFYCSRDSIKQTDVAASEM